MYKYKKQIVKYMDAKQLYEYRYLPKPRLYSIVSKTITAC
mgnify:CR=1 FL=1